MARGRVIQNASSGERIVILESAADTGGSRLCFELQLAAGARVPAAHSHPEQSERFTVLEGEVRFRVGIRRATLGAGETVTVPSGATHSFVNRSARPARLLVEVRPALRTEELLATAAELARSAKARPWLPRPVDLALFLSEFRREVAAPWLPAAPVRALLTVACGVARRMRLDLSYRSLRRST